MSIILGTPTITANPLLIRLAPNSGFDTVWSMRLANTTNDVVVLENVNGVGQGSEYLMPYTQTVYRTRNVMDTLRAYGLTQSASVIAAALLVEFGTDPIMENDFPGTYPYAMAGTS